MTHSTCPTPASSACLEGYCTHGPRIQYYGIVEHGGRLAEVLVTREHGRQVSQELTGVTYKTMREADRDNAKKNVAVAAAILKARR